MMVPMKLLNCPCAAELVCLSKSLKRFSVFLSKTKKKRPDECREDERNYTKLTFRQLFPSVLTTFCLISEATVNVFRSPPPPKQLNTGMHSISKHKQLIKFQQVEMMFIDRLITYNVSL